MIPGHTGSQLGRDSQGGGTPGQFFQESFRIELGIQQE